MTGTEQLLTAAKEWSRSAYLDDDVLNRHTSTTVATKFLRDLRDGIAAFEDEQAERVEPIDAEWLRRVGAVKEDHPCKWRFDRNDALPIGLWFVSDGWKAMLVLSENCQSCIVRGLMTRGQVLDLLATFQSGTR